MMHACSSAIGSVFVQGPSQLSFSNNSMSICAQKVWYKYSGLNVDALPYERLYRYRPDVLISRRKPCQAQVVTDRNSREAKAKGGRHARRGSVVPVDDAVARCDSRRVKSICAPPCVKKGLVSTTLNAMANSLRQKVSELCIACCHA